MNWYWLSKSTCISYFFGGKTFLFGISKKKKVISYCCEKYHYQGNLERKQKVGYNPLHWSRSRRLQIDMLAGAALESSYLQPQTGSWTNVARLGNLKTSPSDIHLPVFSSKILSLPQTATHWGLHIQSPKTYLGYRGQGEGVFLALGTNMQMTI